MTSKVLLEGNIKRGGLNPPPTTPKLRIAVHGQKPLERAPQSTDFVTIPKVELGQVFWEMDTLRTELESARELLTRMLHQMNGQTVLKYEKNCDCDTCTEWSKLIADTHALLKKTEKLP